MMAITDWPEGERSSRENSESWCGIAFRCGVAGDLLRTGVVGKSAVDLARELLTQFGSLTQFICRQRGGFLCVHGMEPGEYVQLQPSGNVVAWIKRGIAAWLTRSIRPRAAARLFAIAAWADGRRRFFWVLFLDYPTSCDRLEELFQGTLSQNQRVSARSG